MLSADPRAVPLSYWHALRPLAATRFDASKLARLELFMLDGRRVMAQPQTFQALLHEMVAAFVSSPLTPEEARVFAPVLAALGAPVPQPASLDPAAAAIATIVARARAVLGVGEVDAIIAPLLTPTTALQWITSASDDALTPNDGFEHRVARGARTLANLAEAAYKPLLRAALELWRRTDGSTSAVPHLLGPLIQQCRDAWPTDLADALLDPQIVVVRNSEHHHHTRYDIAGERVTFVNVKPDGSEVALAPMTELEVGIYLRDFAARCAAMHAGFAGFAGRAAVP